MHDEPQGEGRSRASDGKRHPPGSRPNEIRTPAAAPGTLPASVVPLPLQDHEGVALATLSIVWNAGLSVLGNKGGLLTD
ncbi:MAG: hypothetical protein ACYTFD_15980, partial [Planctomycetota bacterium]